MSKVLNIAIVVVLLTGTSAWADWFLGDEHKMHYPQMPDEFGWDVQTGWEVLADDWKCSQTGPVSDIHYWYSIYTDRDPSQIIFSGLTVRIFSDIPAGSGGVPYSMPGDLLWERSFDETQITRILYGHGEQGWLDTDPETGQVRPYDHSRYYQANIVNIDDPFIQEEGTIYWLNIQTRSSWDIGWKTSLDHWNDDAVFADVLGAPWHELRDPLTGQSLDLAFVITPEPVTLGLVVLGAFGLLIGRRRR